ncbi:hypothetical protein [Streptomyces sp. NPDC089799]|uniref:hypothetical protein n=1 Tax=Streptomyces sp. NPDC089799 TaxID=3155066 RepID=UPI0034259BA0
MTAGLAAVLLATAGGCSHPLADLGPLPPRHSGPPLPTEAVVREMTASLEAAGFTVARDSQDMIQFECTEWLTGRLTGPAPHTPGADAGAVDTALRKGEAEARGRGWQDGIGLDPAIAVLSLGKGNWRASASTLQDPRSGSTLVRVNLMCDDARTKKPSGSPHPGPSSTHPGPSPAEPGDEPDPDL